MLLVKVGADGIDHRRRAAQIDVHIAAVQRLLRQMVCDVSLLGMGAVGSSYGAAGSFVVPLLWVYYSTQILLFGAEFTQVYARRCGHGLVVAGTPVAPPRPHYADTRQPSA